MTSEFLRYLEEKRRLLPHKKRQKHEELEKNEKKRKNRKKKLDMMDSIDILEKGEVIKIPIDNAKDANNLRVYFSLHRQNLRPDVRNVHIVYKREQNLLYIYR